MYCPSCYHANPAHVDDYCTKCGVALDGSGRMNPLLLAKEDTEDTGGVVIGLSDGCRIVLLESSLVFKDRVNGTQVEIPREEAPGRLERMGLTKRSPSLIVHVPKPKRFTLGKDGVKGLLEWLGPETPAEAQHQLKRKVGFNIPIGIFYLVTAFSDVWWWVIGSLLLCTGLLFKYRPRVWLFLLDGVFWLLVLLYQLISFSRDPGWFTGLLVLMNAYFLFQSVRLYRRFSTSCTAPVESTAS